MKLLLLFLFAITVPVLAQDAAKYSCKKTDITRSEKYLKDKVKIDSLAESIRHTKRGVLPFCWHACVVKLPKPYFSEMATRYQISGKVTVNAVSDENGQIFYAKPVSGPHLLRNAAKDAACNSKFIMVMYDNKAIQFPWVIVYNFTR
jgi:hypothetical protein